MHLFEFESRLSLLKKQSLAAKNTEIKLCSFFESATSECMMLDKKYRIMAFNKRLRDFVQQEYQIIIEKEMKVAAFIHERDINDFLTNCERALLGEMIMHKRLIQLGKTSHWYELTYDPAKNAKGEIIGVSYNSSDINERIAHKNEVLRQQNKLIKIAFLILMNCESLLQISRDF